MVLIRAQRFFDLAAEQLRQAFGAFGRRRFEYAPDLVCRQKVAQSCRARRKELEEAFDGRPGLAVVEERLRPGVGPCQIVDDRLRTVDEVVVDVVRVERLVQVAALGEQEGVPDRGAASEQDAADAVVLRRDEQLESSVAPSRSRPAAATAIADRILCPG